MLEVWSAEECPQGSDFWHRLHVGLPTASNFRSLMATSEDRKMRAAYMRIKAAEIITREPVKGYRNAYMDRGHVMEPEARVAYQFTRNVIVKTIGFARDLEIGGGCSPDGLVDEEGMVEFKSMEADALVEFLLPLQRGRAETRPFPSEHYAQCQGGLLIMARQWCDLVIYAPRMPLYVQRTVRNVEYITRLRQEIKTFNVDVKATVEQIVSAK